MDRCGGYFREQGRTICWVCVVNIMLLITLLTFRGPDLASMDCDGRRARVNRCFINSVKLLRL